MNDFPSTPFPMILQSASPTNGKQETVIVRAVHGHTLTVVRGQSEIPATPPATGYVDTQPFPFLNGDLIDTLNDLSYGAATVGQASASISGGADNGESNPLALVNLPLNINATGAAHEMGSQGP